MGYGVSNHFQAVLSATNATAGSGTNPVNSLPTSLPSSNITSVRKPADISAPAVKAPPDQSTDPGVPRTMPAPIVVTAAPIVSNPQQTLIRPITTSVCEPPSTAPATSLAKQMAFLCQQANDPHFTSQTQLKVSTANDYIASPNVPVSSTPLYQLQKVALETPIARPVAAAVVQPVPTTVQSNLDHPQVANLPTTQVKFSTTSAASHLHPTFMAQAQQHMMCNNKQLFNSHHSPLLPNSPQHQQQQTPVQQPQPRIGPSTLHSATPQATALPQVSDRSPPLSAQSFIDRLAGIVEPSVAVAIAQAAMAGGAGLARGLNEAAAAGANTDAQVLSYLKRLVQQILDARPCNGPTKVPVQSCPTESQNHPGALHISCMSPPTSTINVNASPQRPNQGLPFTSPMSVNTVEPDLRPSDPGVCTGALISPPVGVPRQSVSSDTVPPNTVASLPVTQSWSTLETVSFHMIMLLLFSFLDQLFGLLL